MKYMFVEISQERLSEALQHVSRAVSQNSPIPVLTGIQLTAQANELILTASRSSMTVQYTCSAPSDGLVVVRSGCAVVPGQHVCHIVRKLPPGPVIIETNEDRITTIRSGSVVCRLCGMDPELFPLIPSIEDPVASISMQGELLQSLVRQVGFAVSTSETRPVLTGVLAQFHDREIRFIASDGIRLASRTVQLYNEGSMGHVVPINRASNAGFDLVTSAQTTTSARTTTSALTAGSARTANEAITEGAVRGNISDTASGTVSGTAGLHDIVIPGKNLIELARMIQDEPSVEVLILANQVAFRTAKMLVFSAWLEGTFPPVHGLIRTSHATEIVLETQVLLHAMERVCLIAGEHQIVKLVATPQGTMELTSESHGVGDLQEEISLVQIQGEPLVVYVNGKYMLDVLKAVENSRLRLRCSGSERPVFIEPGEEGTDCYYIVTPIRSRK